MSTLCALSNLHYDPKALELALLDSLRPVTEEQVIGQIYREAFQALQTCFRENGLLNIQHRQANVPSFLSHPEFQFLQDTPKAEGIKKTAGLSV